MIISDAPNCGVTYDCHYDDRNSLIIQATGVFVPTQTEPDVIIHFTWPNL